MPQMMMAAMGVDKPGLVGQLTGHLAAGGANILESRMVNLRGEFAVLVVLEGSTSDLNTLRQTLPAQGEKMGLKVIIAEMMDGMAVGGDQKDSTSRQPVQGLPYQLKTYSMDQPGLVHRITDVLRENGVNIEELTARQQSAPFAGSPLFVMEIRLTVPASVPLRNLRTDLESVCAQINCDMDLEPA